jgi:endonuclease-3
MLNVNKIISTLKNHYKPKLSPGDPFRVLITTLISQRTKDANTEKASKQLFAKYPNPKSLASAPLHTIQSLIKPAGFYKQKAKRIKYLAEIFSERAVPDSIDELIKLPGVGRKTANCYLFAMGKTYVCREILNAENV